ncbi:homoserine dehydrogenase [Ferroacidibacillus organovorans]|uniref:Homoserine dehydrogenase n=1 Tax=Ferroacidibacillus organovorans TaxID=1765683 RepID=A0A101XSE7_9BACL|nr:homoserine dehydrogenase [Ferroacidibacillus organovorans]KUO96677.1 hypothetical protein ATW55_07565 [Ferroacidibacillus organovorans]
MADQPRVVRIGLLGLGTVGAGVVKSLKSNHQPIFEKTGCDVQVVRTLVRDPDKERAVRMDRDTLTTDGLAIVRDPAIDIVIEVIGGIEPARTLIREALRHGKHVISANKELIAKDEGVLIEYAEKNGLRLMYEASVGGGIPIVRMVETYLTANRVHAIRGILNGTCNYILTRMEEDGQSFAEALRDAQALGYAEADPESDVEGFDTAYKLSILANLAFSVPSSVFKIDRMGITKLQRVDLDIASRMGCTIKLIGEARVSEDGTVAQSVSPRMIPRTDSLATVRDVFNAVTITADVVGELSFMGRGAGELPTASAIIEDLTEILRNPTPNGRRDQDRRIVKQGEGGDHALYDTDSPRLTQGYIRMTASDWMLDHLVGHAQDVRVLSNTVGIARTDVSYCFVRGMPECAWKELMAHDSLQLAIPYDGVWPPLNSVAVEQKEAQIQRRA